MINVSLSKEVRRARRRLAIVIVGIVAAFSLFESVETVARFDLAALALRTADITVDNKITLGTGSATITQYGGSPAGSGAVKGSLVIDTSTPGIWQNSTGSNTWTQLGTGGGGGSGSGSGSLGSGSITITTAVATTPVNLSTTGTIDWIPSLAASINATRLLTCTAATTSNCRLKKTGADQLVVPGLEWLGSCSSAGTGAGLVTFTSTSTDDTGLSALSTTQITYCANAGANASGFRYSLPSIGGNTTWVARMWVYQYDSAVTCTATATDGTAAGSSATTNTGSGGVTNEYLYTISYSTNTAQPVVVTCIQTTAQPGTGTPNMGWGAATLGKI